jgi:hypothetical protein
MPTENKKSDKKLIKLKPTIFPLGFSVSKVEDSLIIINFADEINGEKTIIESIAMPKEKAAQLATALSDAIKNDEKDD